MWRLIGIALGLRLLDRSVSLVRDLSARFYASEVSKIMVTPFDFSSMF
ncbi:hypothetical protein SLEP1_g15218 [Rubroshorea leprosula]|uniref:Uncharacterized protein n=1 Tax=Rubroshorea leprosula TaxID=152421 RepID=A0AAV5IXE6_9ROSI|nr:hypothetical protein SLEP1_g15218 [Rubroshorea leprosula]